METYMELCLVWNFALHGTLPRLKLCPAWIFARLELCLGWNSALPGTLPRLELYPAWIFSLDGTLSWLELCLG